MNYFLPLWDEFDGITLGSYTVTNFVTELNNTYYFYNTCTTMNMILYHTYKVLFSSSKNLSSKHLFLFILLTKNLIFDYV